jgi:AcrR family transcriptional regulator
VTIIDSDVAHDLYSHANTAVSAGFTAAESFVGYLARNRNRDSMKSATKMCGHERRAAIIGAARRVFVEKGFDRTTTRELAEVAGVSEALLFKHFPSKEALYSAIQQSCFDDEGSTVIDWMKAFEPSTSTLVLLVQHFVSHVLHSRPGDAMYSFHRLMLRSLIDEGEFARTALRGGPSLWVQKVEECIEAAAAEGDLSDPAPNANLAGWFSHQLIAVTMMQLLPSNPVIDYGVSCEELIEQVVYFCLRGMGLKEEAIERYYQSTAVG